MNAVLRRGDIVLVALPGDFGKPRPALVIQADAFLANAPSVTMALITTTQSEARLFRVEVSPTAENGLRAPSFVMCDKVVSHLPDRVRARIGALDPEQVTRVDEGLRIWLGLI
ncbi:MAG: hypothetical protein BGP06_00905 [Rhizobiales bacterium 65-9]|nr:type II toxin-antitoxin system PemK/MazF family toxin [Hyphomicrobiales bacterium]OJY37318.1 MAG: hypothetical protein BGP06_00905 [Rhizobiales bacterium 65-9]